MGDNIKRYKTEQKMEKDLDRMLFLAAEEKLLPKIIYDYAIQNKNQELLKNYRNSVKSIYTKQTSSPLKYSEEEAKTHREKFRQKVLKLMRNDLPIEYLKQKKINGETVMTYQDHPLEAIKYPTKQQYKIFKEFNQSKFCKGFEDIFEEKLEYEHKKIFKLSKRENFGRKIMTEGSGTDEYKLFKNPQVVEPKTPPVKEARQKIISLPKLIARTNMEKSRISSPLQNVTPLQSGRRKLPKQIFHDEESEMAKKIRSIGGYAPNTPISQLSITKESILRYFRQFYPRPHRIIDYLQFSPVESFTTFCKIPKKLKMMPNEHFYFMAFVFYDSNNDGYICNNDLVRIWEMTKKCPLLEYDYNLLKKDGHKVPFENSLAYKQLYKLSEITEMTYFNWLKMERDEKMEFKQINTSTQEIKEYFGYLNRKKIMIHYEGFKKLYKGEKPFLWYELLWRIGNISFEGMRYD